MRCPTPITKRTPQGNKHFPCGKCVFCRKRRITEWAQRLEEELKVSSSALWLCLTYSDESLEKRGHDKIDARDVQLFMKKLRKLHPNKLKYYCVGEYGSGTHRPHYHMILFNYPIKDIDYQSQITRIWENGFVSFDKVQPASIRYTLGYMKEDAQDHCVLISKNLGLSYVSKYIDWHRTGKRLYKPVNGLKMPLARYYKDRLFSSDEKKAINDELIKISDQKELDQINSYISQGENYFTVQQNLVKQLTDSYLKTRTKIKKL